MDKIEGSTGLLQRSPSFFTSLPNCAHSTTRRMLELHRKKRWLLHQLMAQCPLMYSSHCGDAIKRPWPVKLCCFTCLLLLVRIGTWRDDLSHLCFTTGISCSTTLLPFLVFDSVHFTPSGQQPPSLSASLRANIHYRHHIIPTPTATAIHRDSTVPL